MKKLVLILLVGFFLASGGGALFAMNFLSSPADGPDSTVVFEVGPGQTIKNVSRRLAEQGLIKHARLFEILSRVTGEEKRIRVGEYAIAGNLKPREVLELITSGKSIEYTFSFQEGLTKWEIAALVERAKLGSQADFLKLVEDSQFIKEVLPNEDITSLEGYLFPETYKYTKFTGLRGLVKLFVARFEEVYASLKLPAEGVSVQGASGIKLDKRKLLTLASIVEKETGAPQERALVSSVFHNRLRMGMKLQTDPTIVYGILDAGKPYSGNITRADLTTPTRYNTYVINGLPPGPISNPGLDSLRAAAEPASSDYLFFVSRGDGTHVFSKDYAGHSKAVGEFQMKEKAREGKSWRDLTKELDAAKRAGTVEKKK